MLSGVLIRVIRFRKYVCWMLLRHHKSHAKSLKFLAFYNVWRFQNEYGCSILIALCFPPAYVYIIVCLAVEIQWYVEGSPSNGSNHSRAIIVIMVGGWGIPTFQVYA